MVLLVVGCGCECRRGWWVVDVSGVCVCVVYVWMVCDVGGGLCVCVWCVGCEFWVCVGVRWCVCVWGGVHVCVCVCV